MNTPNDEEIEALLGKLSPAPPDPVLMARLRAARPRPVILRPVFWTPLAAAAAIAMAFILSGNEAPEADGKPATIANNESTDAPKRVPVASKQHLMEVVDLGVVENAKDQPVRLIRTTWLDEIYYAAAVGETPEKESQIREEVLPVSLTVY